MLDYLSNHPGWLHLAESSLSSPPSTMCTDCSSQTGKPTFHLHPMMLQQKIHKQPHPRRHRGATQKHRMNRFTVAGIPGLQQRCQVTTPQVLADGELAYTRNAGAKTCKLGQRFTTAAFDVAADLEGKFLAVARKRPVGLGAPEIEAKAVMP